MFYWTSRDKTSFSDVQLILTCLRQDANGTATGRRSVITESAGGKLPSHLIRQRMSIFRDCLVIGTRSKGLSARMRKYRRFPDEAHVTTRAINFASHELQRMPRRLRGFASARYFLRYRIVQRTKRKHYTFLLLSFRSLLYSQDFITNLTCIEQDECREVNVTSSAVAHALEADWNNLTA
jgi:hypothetical protein